MPNTPIDEHTDEFEQLAGLFALQVLEGDELAQFEEHSATCERCQLMVRLDREALGRLLLVAPAMDPSPDFKQRLMRRAAEELAASAAAAPTATAPPTAAAPATPAAPVTPVAGLPASGTQPTAATTSPSSTTTPPSFARPAAAQPGALRPSNVVSFRRRQTWLSALAAVVVLGLVTFGAVTYENQPVATYDLTGSAPGSARVVVRRSGAAELEMNGVPNPEPGFLYEAWIIPAGKQPVAAGTTTTGDAKLPLSGDIRGSTVAITKERSRVDAPTSAPILAAVVQS